MELVLPNLQYKESFLEAVEKHKQSGEHDGFLDTRDYDWFKHNFDTFLAEQEQFRNGVNLPDDKVPSTQWWVVEGDTWLGRFSLRHRLNETLETYGGHLGYYLIPEARRKGVGSWAMSEVLHKARTLGLQKLLVTCDPDNIGSQKLIQKFGGVHLDTIDSELNGGPLMRWWIELSN